MVMPSLPRVATVVLNQGIPANTQSLGGGVRGPPPAWVFLLVQWGHSAYLKTLGIK